MSQQERRATYGVTGPDAQGNLTVPELDWAWEPGMSDNALEQDVTTTLARHGLSGEVIREAGPSSWPTIRVSGPAADVDAFLEKYEEGLDDDM